MGTGSPYWQTLVSDEDAVFDRELTLDANKLEPMVTYGTNPGQGVGGDRTHPYAGRAGNSTERRSLLSSLEYMGLKAGQPMAGQPVDIVFIGSCTNGRIEDPGGSGAGAGETGASGVQALVVPGSKAVKAQAEAEGLDRTFSEAGFEWRGRLQHVPGHERRQGRRGQICGQTSNRNFQGRHGPRREAAHESNHGRCRGR